MRMQRLVLVAAAISCLAACGDDDDNEGNGSSIDGAGIQAGSVGVPCEDHSDCADGLICRGDEEDYLAHKQCTTSCDSSEACEAAHGEHTMCIGAYICTLSCRGDDDCPDKTWCNTAGWCERGGPGSGVPYCGGSPTPCSLLDSSDCISAGGCTDDSECSGVATSCLSYYSSVSCGLQDGCRWDSYFEDCSGVATSCSSSLLGEYTCALQEGCSWSGGCSGTPDSCDGLSASLCEYQPGCALVSDG